MTSVFISGSIDLKSIPQTVRISLDNIINQNLHIVIGDAEGIDLAVQKYLNEKKYFNVTIFSITSPPRNCISDKFNIKYIDYKNTVEYISLSEQEKAKIEYSERKKQTFKDIEMSKYADYFLTIWDGKSEGTKNNLLRGIQNNKKIKLIINNEIIQPDIISEEYINNIFDDLNGIGIKELRRRLDNALGEDNIPSKDYIKHSDLLKNIYPLSSKTFLKDGEKYHEYLILSNYKGAETIKYRPILINILKEEIIRDKNNYDENLLLNFG